MSRTCTYRWLRIVTFVNIYFTGQSCSSGNSLAENQNIVLKNPSGIIKTPGYPFNYPDNLIDQCYWKILAPKGSVVRVEFSSFRLRRGDCVNIINAMNRRFPIRSTLYCGKHPSFVVYSMTNELGINAQERLHLSNTGPGFTANYTTVPAGKNDQFSCRYFGRHATLLLVHEEMSVT